MHIMASVEISSYGTYSSLDHVANRLQCYNVHHYDNAITRHVQIKVLVDVCSLAAEIKSENAALVSFLDVTNTCQEPGGSK